MTNKNNNILIIMPVIPCENGKGIQKRAAAHLKALATVRHIYLIIFEPEIDSRTTLDAALSELCEFVNIIPAPERQNEVFSSLPPFSILSEIMTPWSERLVPEDKYLKQAVTQICPLIFNEIFCFRVRSAVILERMLKITPLSSARKIVDFDDIESLVNIRSKAFSSEKLGFEQSIIEKIMLKRLINIENRLLHNSHDIIVCSALDKQILKDKNPTAQIHAIPNSVPLEDISEPAPNRPLKTINILFVGTMSYGPNKDGILWFCNEILPLIRERTDISLSLFVVGFNPQQSVLALGDIDGITVTGGVESVEPYYRDSHIVIAPIRYGGGTRIKILEAMGFQRPVISTTIGAEGIDIENGKDILIADSPDDFANACVRLMEDEELGHKMGAAARKNIEQKYCDDVIAKRLQQIIE